MKSCDKSGKASIGPQAVKCGIHIQQQGTGLPTFERRFEPPDGDVVFANHGRQPCPKGSVGTFGRVHSGCCASEDRSSSVGRAAKNCGQGLDLTQILVSSTSAGPQPRQCQFAVPSSPVALGRKQLYTKVFGIQLQRFEAEIPGGFALAREEEDARQHGTKDARKRIQISTLPGQADRLESGSRLAFHKYDDTYFLSQIRSEGAVCQLTRSKVEKETAARFSHAQRDVTLKAE